MKIHLNGLKSVMDKFTVVLDHFCSSRALWWVIFL